MSHEIRVGDFRITPTRLGWVVHQQAPDGQWVDVASGGTREQCEQWARESLDDERVGRFRLVHSGSDVHVTYTAGFGAWAVATICADMAEAREWARKQLASELADVAREQN